jgi:predicted ABC-type ATPase
MAQLFDTTEHERGTEQMTFTIVGGVNGTGKSSLSGVLKDTLDNLGVIVDPDKITAQMGGDEYAAGQAAIDKLQACLAQRIDFTEESTLSDSYSRKMARAARDAGYTVRLYYVGLDTAEESLQRIANRVKHGGHNIPTEDVQRRFARRFDDLAKLLPLCNEGTFYDNENGFQVVATYRNGKIIPASPAERRPEWLLNLMQVISR